MKATPVNERDEAVLFTRLPRGRDYHILRGSMDNSRIAFARRKQGRVAFLGGSITNAAGWRDQVCRSLEKRFPGTRFDFINAGIPSLGSVPHAFRLRRDVLARGPVDLLFVEAAVNDATNHPDDPTLWLRGMEGIVRQARLADPGTDIVLMHFVEPASRKAYDAGRTPAVIAAHERVAVHYAAPSLDLACEVTERIAAGQFSWEKDFQDLHPAPFGHRLYAASIDRLLDAAWARPFPTDARPVSHVLPPRPLDARSFFRARLIDIGAAKCDGGWRRDPSWRPTGAAQAPTRPGFVDVPMLVAEEPGATLTLPFTGTAVGVWVVAGPDVGIIEYRIDGSDGFRRRDPFTEWSGGLHLPWVLMLESDLPDGKHLLTLRTTGGKNPNSQGNACRIVHFLVNGG